MDGEFEAVKQQFQKVSSDQKVSVYAHLTQLVLKLIEENPTDPVKQFENISKAVKDARVRPEVLPALNTFPADATKKTELREWAERFLQLCGKPPAKPVDEEEEVAAPEPVPIERVANVLGTEDLLKWAGIRLTNQQLFALQHCIRELGRQHTTVVEPRFFGKFYGTIADYWVVESKLSEYGEKPAEASDRYENPGSGANEFAYFVCTDLVEAKWVQLPDVSPEQIKTSRRMREFLTGDLEATVRGRVLFPWPEASYLRCLCGRIAAATVLAPAGYYQGDEDAENNPFVINVAEEFNAPDDPTSGDFWVHTRGHLRLEGRLAKFVKPEEEEPPEEDVEPTAEETEEVISILRAISGDAASETPAMDDDTQSRVWSLRSTADTLPHRVAWVESSLWPGAVTSTQVGSNRFVSVYFGNGLKLLGSAYTPSPPDELQKEFNEWETTEEPNPDNADEPIVTKETMFKEFNEYKVEQVPSADNPEETTEQRTHIMAVQEDVLVAAEEKPAAEEKNETADAPAEDAEKPAE